ncbi:MAG: J domain-containing protein [Geminicoccaceae bacterium]|nr:J domain-containing protein [Geminicoccaceae bacterium]
MTSRSERPRLHQRIKALRLDEVLNVEDGRCCEWPGCDQRGDYRAPRSRERLRDFMWLCLEHVRDYNRSWNYFSGMSDADVEAHLRADVTWHRPCWPFAGIASGDHPFADPFGFFTDETEARERTRRRHAADDKMAAMMRVLGVEHGFTRDQLKSRYKDLAKRNHPDLNGGDRAAEERLKRINEAYSFLKDAYAAAG